MQLVTVSITLLLLGCLLGCSSMQRGIAEEIHLGQSLAEVRQSLAAQPEAVLTSVDSIKLPGGRRFEKIAARGYILDSIHGVLSCDILNDSIEHFSWQWGRHKEGALDTYNRLNAYYSSLTNGAVGRQLYYGIFLTIYRLPNEYIYVSLNCGTRDSGVAVFKDKESNRITKQPNTAHDPFTFPTSLEQFQSLQKQRPPVLTILMKSLEALHRGDLQSFASLYVPSRQSSVDSIFQRFSHANLRLITVDSFKTNSTAYLAVTWSDDNADVRNTTFAVLQSTEEGWKFLRTFLDPFREED